MSTKTEKYRAICEKQENKYGNCLTIVIGKYDGRDAAFLLQNMFPITEDYLDHIHTRNGNPVSVTHSLQEEIRSNLKRVRLLISKGSKLVFPDILRLERLMKIEIKEKHYQHLKQDNGIFRKFDSVTDKATIEKIVVSTDCETIKLDNNKIGLVINKKDENILNQIESKNIRHKTL